MNEICNVFNINSNPNPNPNTTPNHNPNINLPSNTILYTAFS